MQTALFNSYGLEEDAIGWNFDLHQKNKCTGPTQKKSTCDVHPEKTLHVTLKNENASCQPFSIVFNSPYYWDAKKARVSRPLGFPPPFWWSPKRHRLFSHFALMCACKTTHVM